MNTSMSFNRTSEVRGNMFFNDATTVTSTTVTSTTAAQPPITNNITSSSTLADFTEFRVGVAINRYTSNCYYGAGVISENRIFCRAFHFIIMYFQI